MDNYAILLATYNGAKYIGEMLDSLDRQTRQDFKCYIHDDDSTDNTLAIIQKHIKNKNNYELMQFNSKQGAKNNFMEMLRRVDAEYYMFADQDDVWLDTKVERLIGDMERAERNTSATPTGAPEESIATMTPAESKMGGTPLAIHSDMFVTDDNLNIISDSFIRYIGRDIHRNSLSRLLIDNPAAGTTMIINRELRDRALEYNDIDDIPMHDQWIMCVAAATGRIYIIDEPLVYYRQHESNVMGAEEEGKAAKIVRNIKDVATGEFARNKRTFHQKEINLARQLMYVSGIDVETKKFLIDLIHINNQGKLQRMEFYRKNGLDRNEHSLWMRLWV